MSIMLDEIREQPDVLTRTLTEERSKYARLANTLGGRDIDLIVMAARGSSDNAALFGRYLLEITTGIPVSLAAPSVYTLYNAKLDLARALVIGVSQSGEGSDINLVLESAKSSGAFTLGITNEAGSSMASIADETMLIHAGRERSVAATKTYTGQMLHFYLLADALVKNGDLDVDQIPDLTAQALELENDVAELVRRYIFMENCVVVGRGYNYGNSYELALKLMETCYVVAERFSSADFLHGPLAVVERRFPVLLFGASGVAKSSNVELLERLHDLKADALAITNDEQIASLASTSLLMPPMDEVLSPIPFIVPAQLFAALLSAEKGLNPDAPRSLSKVTKTV